MRYLIILFWFAVVLIKPTIAQIKFLDREQKALSFGVDYSKNDRYQTKGGQLSFSNEGKILWGFLYGRSNTPTINILGFFLEGNILKPSQRIPIGVNGLFAFSKSWYSIPGNATVFNPYLGQPMYFSFERTYSGQTVLIGFENYFILSPDKNLQLMPFVQITRTMSIVSSEDLSEKSYLTAVSLGIDFHIQPKNKNTIVLTPGVIFNNNCRKLVYLIT